MMSLTKWATLLAVMSCLAGCSTTTGSTCDGWRAIRPAASDIETMSDSAVRQIVQHNRHGATVCGWMP